MISWIKYKIHGSRQRLSSMWKNRNGSSKRDAAPSRSISQTIVGPDDEDYLRVYIVADKGTWTTRADRETTVEQLKIMALSHFIGSGESQKLAPNYKLVSVSEKRMLRNLNTLTQEGLQGEDELLLIESFVAPPKDMSTSDSLRGPSMAQINAATRHLKSLNTERKNHHLECAGDFHHEVRKILMTLSEASAKVLSPTPDAQKLINLIKEQNTAKKESDLNSLSVKALMELGFTREQALRGLKKNPNHREAFEWLMEHGNDPASDSDEETEHPGPSTSQGTASTQTLIEVVDELLEKCRRVKKREFKPSQKSILLLQEMGFQEEQAREALKITGNNQNAACEWLIGERRASLQDMDTGLDPSSPIYEALMSNASVQLSLSNPRMLLAFLSMLTNPNSANLWLNDPEAAPFLNTIFKIYHAEKHVNRPA